MVDEKRHPFLQTAAYSPFVIGAGYSFVRLKKGWAQATQPTPAGTVKDKILEIARGTVNRAMGAPAAMVGQNAKLLEEMQKAHAAITDVSHLASMSTKENMPYVTQAFAKTLNMPEFGLARSTRESAFKRAFGMVSANQSDAVTFMTQQIHKLGPAASYTFEQERNKMFSARERLALAGQAVPSPLRIVSTDLGKIEPRYIVKQLSHISGPTQEQAELLDRLQQSSYFKSLKQKHGFDLALAEQVLESKLPGMTDARVGKWQRVHLQHPSLEAHGKQITFHIPLKSSPIQNTILSGEGMTPYRIGGLSRPLQGGGREIIRGLDLQYELFEQQMRGISSAVNKEGIFASLSAYTQGKEDIASLAIHDPLQVTRGQKAIALARSGIITPVETAIHGMRLQREELMEIIHGTEAALGRRLELWGPAQLTKGQMVDPMVQIGGKAVDVSKMIANESVFDRTNRMFQTIRDTGFAPTEDVARAFNMKTLATGRRGGIDVPEDMSVSRLRHGRSPKNPAFDRWRGISHTREAEEFARATGYISPQTGVMHTRGKKAIEAFRKYNIHDGEGLVRAVFDRTEGSSARVWASMEQIQTRGIHATKQAFNLKESAKIMNRSSMNRAQKKYYDQWLRKQFGGEAFGNLLRFEMPGQYKILGGTDEARQFLAAAGLEPHLLKQTKELGKPLTISRQGKMGKGIGSLELGLSPSGGMTKALTDKHLTEKLVGIEWNAKEGFYTLRTKQIWEGMEMTKLMGHGFGRVSLKGAEDDFTNIIANVLSGGAKDASRDFADAYSRSLLEGTNIATASSWAAKGDRAAIQSQMVGGLMRVLEGRRTQGGLKGTGLEEIHKNLFSTAFGKKGYAPLANMAKMLGSNFENFEEKFITTLGPKLNKLTSFELGGIFGLVAGENSETLTQYFGKEFQESILKSGKDGDIQQALRQHIARRFASADSGKAVQPAIMKELEREFGLDIGAATVGEPGVFRELRRGSVERRNLEMIEMMMQLPDAEGRKVAMALYAETLGATMTPEKAAKATGFSHMTRSFSGKMTPGELEAVSGAVKKSLADMEWSKMAQGMAWPEMDTLVDMTSLRSKAKAAGINMGKELFIPGNMGKQVMNRGELVADNVSSELGRLMEQLVQQSTTFGSDNATFKRTAENLQMKLFEFHRRAQNDLSQGLLSEGSEYMKATSFGLDAEVWKAHQTAGQIRGLRKQILNKAGIITRQEIISAHGSRMAFLSQSHAEQMLDRASAQMKRQGIAPWWENVLSGESLTLAEAAAGGESLGGRALKNMSFREAFLKGVYAMPAMVGRMPGNRMFSMQYGFMGVARHNRAQIMISEQFGKIGKELAGKKADIGTGMGFGMGLDFDADSAFIQFFMDEKNVGVLQNVKLLASKEFEKAYVQGIGQTKMIRDAVVEGMAKYAGGVVADYEGRSKQILSSFMQQSEIGKISNTMTRVRLAMMSHGENPMLNLVGNILLTEVEETAGLKVKKWKNPAPIAAELSEAMGIRAPGAGGKIGPDISKFTGIIREILQGGGIENVETVRMMDIPALGDSPLKVTLPPREAILTNIENAFKKAVVSGDTVYNDLIRMEGHVGRHNIDMASEVMYEVTGRAEQYHASLMAGGAGRSSMRQTISEIGFAKRILEKADKIRMPKGNKYMAPLLMGLTATAALAAVVGGPGYAQKSMIPKTAKLDPNVNKAIQDGTLLMAAQPTRDITPESLTPPYTGGGPTVRAQLPTARLTAPSSNIRVSGYGDMGMARLDRMMAGSRAHFTGANLSGRLRDDRRPLSPNRPDRYGN